MKRSRQLTVLGILLVSGAILLGGCGGGGGDRLSKDEYAAKANTLCAAFNKEVGATGTLRVTEGIAAAMDKLLPFEKKLITDLKALKSPADEEATAKKAIAFGEQVYAGETRLNAALKAGEMKKAQKLTTAIEVPGHQADDLFTQLGATECAK